MEYSKEYIKNAKRDALMSHNKSSDRLFNALCEIDRLNKLHEWIPVTERLPEVKKDTLFLCKFKDAQDNWKVDTKTFWAASSQFSGSCQIAYWMELPK
jgi:hypothetical protein